MEGEKEEKKNLHFKLTEKEKRKEKILVKKIRNLLKIIQK